MRRVLTAAVVVASVLAVPGVADARWSSSGTCRAAARLMVERLMYVLTFTHAPTFALRASAGKPETPCAPDACSPA